ncbi:DUF6098 family protein [Streptomyces sp. NPDC004561]
MACRLHDHAHLRTTRAPVSRPWLLKGRETGRGPDNEPLVIEVEPLCRIAEEVIDEARAEVARQGRRWGTLRRGGR